MTTTTRTPLAALAFVSNADAYAAYQAAADRLYTANASGEFGGPAFDEYVARARVVCDSVLPLLVRQFAKPGDTVLTVDGPITVASVDDWTDVTMTADGGPVVNAWHDGDAAAESFVRYERWSVLVGRRSHGYVDAQSRKITQTG